MGFLKMYVNFLRRKNDCLFCIKLSFPMLHKPWWCLHCYVFIFSKVRQYSHLSQKEQYWTYNLESIQWHFIVIMFCLDERCWTNTKPFFYCYKTRLDQVFRLYTCHLDCGSDKSRDKLARQSAPDITEKIHISVKKKKSHIRGQKNFHLYLPSSRSMICRDYAM